MSRSRHGWETWQPGDLYLRLQNNGTLPCPSLLTRYPTTNGVSLKSAQKEEAWQGKRRGWSRGPLPWQQWHVQAFLAGATFSFIWLHQQIFEADCKWDTMWDHTINHSRDSSILLMNPVRYQMNWMECSSKSHFQTKRCCFKECCCMLFDMPFGNGHFAMSTECIPARNLFELAWPLGPQRLLKE